MIDSASLPEGSLCQHVKEHRQLSFDDAKLRQYRNKNPLYRAYNRGYIGDAPSDYQTVISIFKYLVYSLRT